LRADSFWVTFIIVGVFYIMLLLIINIWILKAVWIVHRIAVTLHFVFLGSRQKVTTNLMTRPDKDLTTVSNSVQIFSRHPPEPPFPLSYSTWGEYDSYKRSPSYEVGNTFKHNRYLGVPEKISCNTWQTLDKHQKRHEEKVKRSNNAVFTWYLLSHIWSNFFNFILL